MYSRRSRYESRTGGPAKAFELSTLSGLKPHLCIDFATTMTDDQQQLQQSARALRDRCRSVLLATVSPAGEPEISYAPFILDEDEAICIYVSELAAHTRNLLADPGASVMFIQPEDEARNIFARERLVLRCEAGEVTGDEADGLLARMESAFGETVALLRSLPDFHLFRLQVEEGSYVRGFGQAWQVQGNRLEIGELRKG